MLRTPSALALSLCLALPGPALAEWQYGQQPAPQRQNNTAVVVGALVALGVLGAILDDDDDDDRDRDRVEVRRRGDDGLGRGDRYGYGGEGGRVLTAECVRHVRGGQRVLAGECLERQGYYVDLPDGCRSWVRDAGRDRPVYDMRCLRGSGYYVR